MSEMESILKPIKFLTREFFRAAVASHLEEIKKSRENRSIKSTEEPMRMIPSRTERARIEEAYYILWLSTEVEQFWEISKRQDESSDGYETDDATGNSHNWFKIGEFDDISRFLDRSGYFGETSDDY
ncbi:hypothetical protein TWF694_004301 [Orbilia ellipsospora]|uniref:Uncharacterized protein n=1 Tax=Orbilia ellipsospora TaxID=2528407 RepID=A0AAV9WYL0_9PEZI